MLLCDSYNGIGLCWATCGQGPDGELNSPLQNPQKTKADSSQHRPTHSQEANGEEKSARFVRNDNVREGGEWDSEKANPHP
jgi:hypothetical protein